MAVSPDTPAPEHRFGDTGTLVFPSEPGLEGDRGGADLRVGYPMTPDMGPHPKP
jgi:hypothetical protein